MGCATDGLQVSYEEKSVLSLYVLSPEHPWQGKENPALVLPPLDVRFGSYISISAGKSNEKHSVLAGLQGTTALKTARITSPEYC